MSPIRVICWGGTGHARVLNEALQALGHSIALFVDNRKIPSPVLDVPIVEGMQGLTEWLAASLDRELWCVAAIGGNRGKDRVRLLDCMAQLGLRPLTVLHPSAYVASDTAIGDGSHVLAMATVCSCARLGRGVIVNTAASVDHDCALDDGVHIGPGARLCGEVSVAREAFVGAGAVVLPRVKLGAGSIVGAGAVVTRDVAPGQTVVGCPARPIVERATDGKG
jgi:sugar O-acyltransferase (sialic acid O-acetyltransferase NeuD family)